MIHNDKIKGPVLFPFTVFMAFGLGAVLYLAVQHEKQERETSLLQDLQTVKGIFDLQIENTADRLQAVLFPISLDQSLKKSFLGGDYKALQTQSSVLFERLRDKHKVTHFSIIDASRRVVLRAHNPAGKGDIIVRNTLLLSEKSQSKTQGIELGALGSLTLRAVSPWYEEGKLIGYLELGENIEKITTDLHQAIGIDLVVLVHPKFGHNKSADASDNPNKSSVYSSTLKNELPPAIAQQLESTGHLDLSEMHFGASDFPYYSAEFELRNVANQHIGDILVLRDETLLQNEFRESLISTSVFVLITGGLVFVLLYIILSRFEKIYHHQREIETQFIHLSKEHQRIVQLEKLSEVGRTISEIAHQINNPLVGVVNMAQLAQREVDDPARVRQLLAEILQAGKDSHSYLQRMLDFSRVSNSEVKTTDLTELIYETISLFQQSTKQHPEVRTELPEAPMIVDIDPILIRHALFNLLSNAAQASGYNSDIQIILQQESNQEGQPGLSLQVIDKGSGISKETQEKLFTPFYTTHVKGTGLGLAVVQHVAMLHGGTVSGGNHPQGGAVFKLWLPIINEKSKEVGHAAKYLAS